MSIKNVLKNYKLLFKDALNDLKTKGKRHKQIPNILTLTRLIAAPLFIIPTAIAGNVPFIVIFTLLFSLTDAVDGFIARRYNLISELGKDLDAICDKFFAGTLLIAASCFSPILLFNLVGELVIAIINIKHKLDGKQPGSLYVGKIKTCVLYPLLGIGILNNFVNDIRKYQLIQVQSDANIDESIFGDKVAFPAQEVALISISKFERMVNDMGLECCISHDNGTSISLINEPTKKYNR